jgi:hypothetical protein
MKSPSFFTSIIALAMLVATVTASYAQNSGDEQKGATGWSGAAKSQVDQGGNNPEQTARDAEAAKSQPLMAEGIDLKGPPRQFAPRLTPE